MRFCLKYILSLLGLLLIHASGCKEEDAGQEVNHISYELVSHFGETLNVCVEYIVPGGAQKKDSCSLAPDKTVTLFTIEDSLSDADSISCGRHLVYMSIMSETNDAIIYFKDLRMSDLWEHTRTKQGNNILHTCSAVIDSSGFRYCNYAGIYECTVIKESWYEVPEIDTVIYWCDTVQENLEFLIGATPEYVIINGTSYGELYVEPDGHFEYYDPTGMFSDPWIDGYFLPGDSLTMKKGWWNDAQYRHLNSYFGKK